MGQPLPRLPLRLAQDVFDLGVILENEVGDRNCWLPQASVRSDIVVHGKQIFSTTGQWLWMILYELVVKAV